MGVNLKSRPIQRNGGGVTYYLDITNNGKRYYEFLKIHVYNNASAQDKKEQRTLAELIRSKRHAELEAAEYSITPKHKRKVDFFEYYQHFLEQYPGKDVRLVKYSFVKFKAYRQEKSLRAINVNQAVCQGFADYLKHKSGLKGETPYNYWKKFKQVVKTAHRDGLIKNNPTEGIRVKRLQNQIKKEVLSLEELQQLSKSRCGNDTVKRAFLFACFTGLGLAELRKLTWGRLSNGKIKLFREKNGEQVINKLHPTALAMAGPRKKSSRLIFEEMPSDTAVNKLLKGWMRKTKIEKHITFYSGRHSYAVNMLIHGGTNLKTLADLMGHTSTAYTVKYLNYVDALKDKAVDSLPGLDL